MIPATLSPETESMVEGRMLTLRRQKSGVRNQKEKKDHSFWTTVDDKREVPANCSFDPVTRFLTTKRTKRNTRRARRNEEGSGIIKGNDAGYMIHNAGGVPDPVPCPLIPEF
jgi:hypothetical protein